MLDGVEVAVNAETAFPPVPPAVYATVAVVTPVVVAVPIVGASGTVVAVIDADGLDAGPVPAAFVPVTVKVYDVLDCNPVTVSGEEDPVAVNPPGEDVTVNEVAGAPDVAAVNVTVAAPLLNARPVPTSDAETPVGAFGCKKPLVFCEPVIPIIGITYSFLICVLYHSFYVERSPYKTNVVESIQTSVAAEYCALNTRLGVALTVTPEPP